MSVKWEKQEGNEGVLTVDAKISRPFSQERTFAFPLRDAPVRCLFYPVNNGQPLDDQWLDQTCFNGHRRDGNEAYSDRGDPGFD